MKKQYEVKHIKKRGKEVCVFTILNEDLCHAIQTFLRRKRKSKKSKSVSLVRKPGLAKKEIIKHIYSNPIANNMTTPNDVSIITPAERINTKNIIIPKKITSVSSIGTNTAPIAEPRQTSTTGSNVVTMATFGEHMRKREEERIPISLDTPTHGYPQRMYRADDLAARAESRQVHVPEGQGRLGRKILPMAIDSDDIKTIADSNLDKTFWKGVVARDTISEIKPNKTKPFGFIFNTDLQSGKGIHWRSMLIDPKATHRTCEYFDSFGESPNKEIRAQIDDLLSKVSPHKFQFKINRVQTQNNNTETCGWHALKFLHDRSIEKLPFKAATNFNESDVADTAPPFAYI